MKTVRWFAVAAVSAFSVTAAAQSGPVVYYHGFVTNSRGDPVTAPYTIKFTLYDQPAGGTAVWTESSSIMVDSGNLAAPLGATTPLTASLFRPGPLYLALDLGAGDLPTRQR